MELQEPNLKRDRAPQCDFNDSIPGRNKQGVIDHWMGVIMGYCNRCGLGDSKKYGNHN